MGKNNEHMVRTRFSKLLAPLAAIAVFGSLMAPTSAGAGAAAANSACGGSVLVLRSLHVEAHPSKTVVRRGEKFKVHIKVTRPAHEDPAGEGIEFTPPTSAPAEDVTVGLSIWVGERTYFWQVGVTDANGEDTLTVKVPKNAEYGSALASASGRRWIKNDCPDILEDGYTNYIDFVKVVP